MSTFGMIHTAISILPIGLGLAAFVRDGKVDLRNWLGKSYLLTMLAGSVTSLGFLFTKGFNPAQVLTFVTLGFLWMATLTLRGNWRPSGYIQTISFSTSYLLLMVFTTTETLTRIPVGQPFASGPDDPALIPVRLGLLAAFAVGLGYQILQLRLESRPNSAPQQNSPILRTFVQSTVD